MKITKDAKKLLAKFVLHDDMFFSSVGAHSDLLTWDELAAAGLVKERPRVYELTDYGRKYLKKLLTTPPTKL